MDKKNKTKLIGSADSIEALQKPLQRYFYSYVNLKKVSENEWRVINPDIGVLDGFRVIKKQDRYRFEMEL